MFEKRTLWFPSLSVKLFLCFWLIIATSIATTLFLSYQLSEEYKVQKPSKNDLRKLKKLAEKGPLLSLKKLQRLTSHSLKEKTKGRHWTIIAKPLSGKAIIHSGDKQIKPLVDYLAKSQINKKFSIQRPVLRITGPHTVTVENIKYQLFFVSKSLKIHWSFHFKDASPAIPLLIAILISFIICWLLAKSFTKPILSIKEASALFGDGQLKSRALEAAFRSDELGDLARGFNQMAEKLEYNIDAQQRLLADVSHELRTPLTRLQLAVGLAQQEDISAEKLSKHLARCDKEVMRLDHMIADVLTLSRLENTVKTAKLEKTDIIGFIQQIVDDCQFTASAKNIEIVFNKTQPHTLKIDTKLLGSALSNVLNNAIKYSLENTTVSINVNSEGDKTSITLADNGVGIPEDELKHIFKPFYRVNQLRDKGTTGTGLGLAITKQAVDLHGGDITIANAPHGGTIVTIVLPNIH